MEKLSEEFLHLHEECSLKAGSVLTDGFEWQHIDEAYEPLRSYCRLHKGEHPVYDTWIDKEKTAMTETPVKHGLR